MTNKGILAHFLAIAAELAGSLSTKQPIPGPQHQPLRAVLPELTDLVVLEHAEGFTGVIGTQQVGGIQDVAQLIPVEAVEVGVVGVEFGSKQGAAFGIEGEGWAVVAEVLGPGFDVVAGVVKVVL
jgi:hypothetical protein